MKNKILQKIKFIFIATNLLFVSSLIYADEFEITALKIELDNKNKKIFAKGDVVRLKSGGPRMTVKNPEFTSMMTDPENPEVQVTWFEKETVKTAEFLPEMLETDG